MTDLDLPEALAQLEQIVRRMEAHRAVSEACAVYCCSECDDCSECVEIRRSMLHGNIQPHHYRTMIYAAREAMGKVQS